MRITTKRGFFPHLAEVKELKGFDDDNSSGDDDDEGDDEEDDDSGDKGDKKDPPKSTAEDVEQLKKALNAERLLRRNAQRDLKKLSKKEADDKADEDEGKATKQIIEAQTKVSRLAERLSREAVDNAIVRIAAEMNFADLEDPLGLVKRAQIDVDQDEDDPSDVSVDLDTVREALQDLAKRKPHLLKSKSGKDDDEEEEEDDDDRETRRKAGQTGSRGAGRHKPKKKSSSDQDQELMSGYGAFRAR